MITAQEKAEIEAIYLTLQGELDNNSNLNWTCFSEYREARQIEVKRLQEFLESQGVTPKEWGDDADEACCLFSLMLNGFPNEMPCTDDGSYAALRRILEGLGIVNQS